MTVMPSVEEIAVFVLVLAAIIVVVACTVRIRIMEDNENEQRITERRGSAAHGNRRPH